ncbi:hypothetical protein GQ42DRAFT_166110 [Ramicandelaber brevisporus]|nr:hypothetical protein GQ42DRAFT_166110 [Ramicandelaber brevisporus]
MRILSVATVAALGIAFANAFTYTVCSKPGAIGTVSNVSLKPDPPVSGQTLTVTADITLGATVTGGTVKATAQLGLFPWTTTYDICTIAGQQGDPCPLAPGLHHLVISQQVPGGLSGATVSLKVVGTTTSGQEIACVQGSAKLG